LKYGCCQDGRAGQDVKHQPCLGNQPPSPSVHHCTTPIPLDISPPRHNPRSNFPLQLSQQSSACCCSTPPTPALSGKPPPPAPCLAGNSSPGHQQQPGGFSWHWEAVAPRTCPCALPAAGSLPPGLSKPAPASTGPQVIISPRCVRLLLSVPQGFKRPLKPVWQGSFTQLCCGSSCSPAEPRT